MVIINTLVCVVVSALPQKNEDFAKEKFVEGWTMIIGAALKEYLERI